MQNPIARILRPLRALRYSYVVDSVLKHYAGHPVRVLSATIQVGLLAHIFNAYGYSAVGTWGASMLPTIEVVGDWILISRYYRRGRDIKIGDLVSFRSVVDPDEMVVKRVLGMEGDYVLRNTPGTRSDDMLQVPEGHCWVVGDNLDASRDSRHFGPMPMALIKGKVIAKVLPLKEMRWVDDGLQVVN